MTTSSDRLDRIEALVERNSEAIEQNSAAIQQNSAAIQHNSEAIQKLTEESKELSIRFAAYQQAFQWVVNLAFGLLATATLTTIVTAVLK